MAHHPYMVALVGENPLPIYLGIKQFSDPAHAETKQIVLVHSAETKPWADAIIAMFKKEHQHKFKCDDPKSPCPVLLEKPFDPNYVFEAIKKVRQRPELANAVLNYTGGTKVMSGLSLACWWSPVEGQSGIGNCFYLNEQEQKFLFLDEAKNQSLNVGLTLNDLRNLHGLTLKPESTQFATLENLHVGKMYDLHRNQDCLSVLDMRHLKARKDRMSQWHWLKTQWDANTQKWMPDSPWGTLLTLLNIPEWWQTPFPTETDYAASNQLPTSPLAEQWAWVQGLWFEVGVGNIVYDLLQDYGTGEDSCEYGSKMITSEFTRANNSLFKSNFESDILVVMRKRFYYISVTSSFEPSICKSKMFEAAFRAEQIGGGLARAAVVCTASGDFLKGCTHSIRDTRSGYMFIGKEARNDDFNAWRKHVYKELMKFLDL